MPVKPDFSPATDPSLNQVFFSDPVSRKSDGFEARVGAQERKRNTIGLGCTEKWAKIKRVKSERLVIPVQERLVHLVYPIATEKALAMKTRRLENCSRNNFFLLVKMFRRLSCPRLRRVTEKSEQILLSAGSVTLLLLLLFFNCSAALIVTRLFQHHPCHWLFLQCLLNVRERE